MFRMSLNFLAFGILGTHFAMARFYIVASGTGNKSCGIFFFFKLQFEMVGVHTVLRFMEYRLYTKHLVEPQRLGIIIDLL